MVITREKAEELADVFLAPALELLQVRFSFEAVDEWKKGIVHQLLKTNDEETEDAGSESQASVPD